MPSFELSGGLSLFYRDEGQGEPLLLIHGFPLSGELFRPQRAGLIHPLSYHHTRSSRSGTQQLASPRRTTIR